MNRNDSMDMTVTLGPEDMQDVQAVVEFRERLLSSPPDEESEPMCTIRQMLPSELEAEVRDLLSEEFSVTHRQLVRFYVTQPVINGVAKRVGDNRVAIRDLTIAANSIARILQLIDDELGG